MPRRFLSPGWVVGHVVVLAAVLTCLRLGWWQWDRAHASTGTGQNYGYALLWPAFGAAFIYMWTRFLQLEQLKDAEDADRVDAESTELSDDELAAFTGDGSDDEEEAALDRAEAAEAARRERLQRPSEGVVVGVATVGAEDDDDPELTAYNRALAALAEEDRRRAR
ncbi:hypothetical protein JL107_13340 [Nakamurella flavida]|uniref:Uncharacterized protein n=1 Tax=Nakamurella flavida TaxID=363630 RepID=A0A938YK27_9ACTN|nr:hypothetical protein [Nakamurella flavida]MBM9477427.1 hypothetical protein [Nakamurella flavida]MDP9777360.1 DNA-binding transcriptional regulator of glucitol operon [Nakamurella flavida]